MPFELGKRKQAVEVVPALKLSAFNQALQRRETLPAPDREMLWDRWTWGCDLCEKYNAEIMFNEAHLLGLLLSRDWFLRCAADEGQVYKGATADLPGVPIQLTLAEQQEIRHMTSKVLVRTVETLQAEWAKVMYRDANEEQWLDAERLVWALFWRVGFFATYSSSSEELFDDPETTEVLPQGQLGYTHSTLRALLDIFVILFRHLDLHRRCVEPRECDDDEQQQLELSVMRPHAVEATKDDFYKLGMHFDALVGARLAYQHRFPGMYNCISQVIYFHSENYERRKHGCGANEHLDALPVLLHMFPQVPVVMEEGTAPADVVDYWMLVSGRVYLMRGGKTPLYHPDIFHVFCDRTPEDENDDAQASGATASQ